MGCSAGVGGPAARAGSTGAAEAAPRGGRLQGARAILVVQLRDGKVCPCQRQDKKRGVALPAAAGLHPDIPDGLGVPGEEVLPRQQHLPAELCVTRVKGVTFTNTTLELRAALACCQ